MSTKTPTLRAAAQALLDAWDRFAEMGTKMEAVRTILASPAQGDDADTSKEPSMQSEREAFERWAKSQGAKLQGYPAAADLPFPCVQLQHGLAEDAVPYPQAAEPTEVDSIAELNHAQWLGLENIRLYAARHRHEEWAKTVLRLCADAGNKGSAIHRSQVLNALASQKGQQK